MAKGIVTEQKFEEITGVTRTDLVVMGQALDTALGLICGDRATVQCTLLCVNLAHTLSYGKPEQDEDHLATMFHAIRANLKNVRDAQAKERANGH
jgi:hypothetical protein